MKDFDFNEPVKNGGSQSGLRLMHISYIRTILNQLREINGFKKINPVLTVVFWNLKSQPLNSRK